MLIDEAQHDAFVDLPRFLSVAEMANPWVVLDLLIAPDDTSGGRAPLQILREDGWTEALARLIRIQNGDGFACRWPGLPREVRPEERLCRRSKDLRVPSASINYRHKILNRCAVKSLSCSVPNASRSARTHPGVGPGRARTRSGLYGTADRRAPPLRWGHRRRVAGAAASPAASSPCAKARPWTTSRRYAARHFRGEWVSVSWHPDLNTGGGRRGHHGDGGIVAMDFDLDQHVVQYCHGLAAKDPPLVRREFRPGSERRSRRCGPIRSAACGTGVAGVRSTERGEHPPVHGAMVDLEAAFEQQFLNVPIAQRIA